jgi:fructose-1,6-bisphosphatase I
MYLTANHRDIHDKSGIFMGSWDEVEKVKQFHKS